MSFSLCRQNNIFMSTCNECMNDSFIKFSVLNCTFCKILRFLNIYQAALILKRKNKRERAKKENKRQVERREGGEIKEMIESGRNNGGS